MTSDCPRKQFIVGLDAGEWDLIRRFCDEGKLPTFRRLIADGASGALETTAAQLPDTVWSSIYSGKNPGTYDKYFYVQYDPKSGDLRHVHDDAFTKQPFWSVLSDAGQRVGVVDAVKFACADSLNGFMVTNWGAHATKATKESLPRELLPQLEQKFGKHPVGDCDKIDDKPKSRQQLRDRILAGVRLRGEVSRHLMQNQEWDVFFTAFSEPHCIGHHFWHGADSSHPRHAEIQAEGLADAIESVYVGIDREIGRMLELVDDNTRCLIVAGHGMGPIYHASWNLPEILDLLGYGKDPTPREAPQAANDANPKKAKKNFWRVLKMVLPGKLQYAIKACLPQRLQDELLFRWYAGRRDWKGCRAFAVPNNDSVGAIRISLQGRDPNGIVPREDYERVRDDIAQALEELRDPATGKSVVRQVTKIHETFSGDYLDQLPDLTILWEQSFPWHAITSQRLGTLNIEAQDARTGSHTPQGFVIVAGPGIEPGSSIHGATIYDIAPTIYATAAVALPPGLDGKPLAVLASSVVS